MEEEKGERMTFNPRKCLLARGSTWHIGNCGFNFASSYNEQWKKRTNPKTKKMKTIRHKHNASALTHIRTFE